MLQTTSSWALNVELLWVLSDCTVDMAFALLMASARNIVEGDKISKSPETKQVSFNFDKGNDQ